MEIALAITSIVAISFLISYLSLLSKFNAVSKGFTQLFIAYNSLAESIENKPEDDVEDVHKENFIKFLSDSRDWAFDYIDTVQKGLKEFIEVADKEFKHFDSFGIITQGSPHYEAMKAMSPEYKKLKELLPQEVND